MRRYFIWLAYDGTNYHGWQVQENAHTVQAELQQALRTVLQGEIPVVGAGRTDAGVHAREMVAHFETEKDVDNTKLTGKLNGVLPDDISVSRIVEVKDDAHARFSATSRAYEYIIVRGRDPFQQGKALVDARPYNIESMNEACAELLKHTDFQAFSKVHTDVNNFDCAIESAEWKEEGNQLVFTIVANRFLRNMVRAVVGTMLEVGVGRMNLIEFRKVIESKDRSEAGASVAAHGLYLTHVAYPEDIYKE